MPARQRGGSAPRTTRCSLMVRGPATWPWRRHRTHRDMLPGSHHMRPGHSCAATTSRPSCTRSISHIAGSMAARRTCRAERGRAWEAVLVGEPMVSPLTAGGAACWGGCRRGGVAGGGRGRGAPGRPSVSGERPQPLARAAAVHDQGGFRGIISFQHFAGAICSTRGTGEEHVHTLGEHQLFGDGWSSLRV